MLAWLRAEGLITRVQLRAVGLTIGRNVWQHPDPVRMTAALRVALVERDIERALAVLE